LEFGFMGHPFAGGHTDVRVLNCPFYEHMDWNTEKSAILEAEKLGFSSIWLPDHLSVGEGGATLENWTTITTYLNLTSKVRAGPLCVSNAFRQPSLVAKIAATLDIISDGRLNVGFGAGWMSSEHSEYGIPFPDSRTRIEMLREALVIVKDLWEKDSVTFDGKYYHLKNAICNPKPVQKPHPPIWIGGGGKKMMKIAAELADGYNWFFSPEAYAEKLGILEKLCSDSGRDFEQIRKSWLGHVLISEDRRWIDDTYEHWFRRVKSESRIDPWVRDVSFEEFKNNVIIGTPDECIEKVKHYRDVGVDVLISWFVDYPSMEGARLFSSKVIPKFK
jgi:alkanesulfonate monooxygenase SsuD/methylene tetrahydromethanopterin reductase-like flavin-dependent oxidoreductase (luciferase family)